MLHRTRPPAHRRRSALVAVVAVAVLLLTACEVQVDVEVAVRDDGSGSVTVGVGLDAEAMARIPDLEQQLRTADLAAAGWVVDPPAADDDGVTWVRVSKPFADAAEADAVLAEVTGEDGPLSGLHLERSDGFATSGWSLIGTADLTEGVGGFVDPSIAELLGGDADGGQLERIEAELGRPAEEMVQLRLLVDLPGASRQTIELPLAERGEVPVSVEASTSRTGPRLLLSAGFVLGVLALLLAGAALLRARSGRSDRAAPPLPTVGRGSSGALEVVVLDAMGVIFEAHDDVRQLLVPYLWEAGCAADEDAIRVRHRQACLGALPSDQIWAELGLPGEAAAHEEYLLYRHRLLPGARELVERLVERGVRVVVVANDVPSWSRRLADLAGLAGLVDAWITSAELGALLPEGPAYRALAARLGVDAARCLVIDDQVRALDAAAAAGFATAWFQPNPMVAASPKHPTLRSLDRLDVAPRAAASAAGA